MVRCDGVIFTYKSEKRCDGVRKGLEKCGGVSKEGKRCASVRK